MSGPVDVLESQIERATNAALGLMVKRANATTTGASFTAADIVSTIVADPMGETARYFAQLIAWAVEWLNNFRTIPDLLEVFGSEK